MSIGNKFLQRLNEAAIRDTDSIKDGFNIPLDNQQKSLASRLKRPIEKKLVALHSMVGISGRYLNSEDAEQTIASAADMLRGQVSVRRQFEKFYAALASSKGYSISEPSSVKEAKEDDAKDDEKIEAYGVRGMKSTQWRKSFKNQAALEKWIDKMDGDVEVQGTRKLDEAKQTKRGGFMQKLMESVLVQLGLPETLVTSGGPGPVGQALLKTAKLIEEDSALEQTLRQLAVKMGIRANDELSEEKEGAAQVGWYVEKANKNVAGPMSEKEAKEECKKRGGAAKGFDISYTSDYSKKRAAMREQIDVGNDAYNSAIMGLLADLGIPDAVLQPKRAAIISALRTAKQSQTNRTEILRKIQILRDSLGRGKRSSANDTNELDPE